MNKCTLCLLLVIVFFHLSLSKPFLDESIRSGIDDTGNILKAKAAFLKYSGEAIHEAKSAMIKALIDHVSDADFYSILNNAGNITSELAHITAGIFSNLTIDVVTNVENLRKYKTEQINNLYNNSELLKQISSQVDLNGYEELFVAAGNYYSTMFRMVHGVSEYLDNVSDVLNYDSFDVYDLKTAAENVFRNSGIVDFLSSTTIQANIAFNRIGEYSSNLFESQTTKEVTNSSTKDDDLLFTHESV